MKKSRYKAARRALIFWTLFVGIGAVAGAAGMLADPTGKAMGMDGMLPYFQVLPFAGALFQDLTFSGYALLIVNGLTNLTAAALIFAKKKAGDPLGGIFGVTLIVYSFTSSRRISCRLCFSLSDSRRRRRVIWRSFSDGRRSSPWIPRIIRASGEIRVGSSCFSRAWDT